MSREEDIPHTFLSRKPPRGEKRFWVAATRPGSKKCRLKKPECTSYEMTDCMGERKDESHFVKK